MPDTTTAPPEAVEVWTAWVCCTACGHAREYDTLEPQGTIRRLDCPRCRACSLDVLQPKAKTLAERAKASGGKR